MAKRIFDLIVATAFVIVLLPLLVALALAIRLTSSGPALYRGERTGRYGRMFFMYKFRTMVVGADRLGGTSTGRSDRRITRVGHTLRKYKLDELPQLFNVIKGDMSLVGPRPEVEEYTRLYSGDEQLILSVRPGITDYSSIRFRNLANVLGEHDVDQVFAERVLPIKNQLRIQYVRQQSFTEDLKILWQTAVAVVRNP